MKFIDYRQDLEVELKSFDKNLIKMNKSDFLPRYNRLIVTITNNSDQTIDFLFLNVKRKGSKIGDDNYDIVPINTYGLKPNSKGKYKLFVFDPFNEKFKNIEVKLPSQDEFEARAKVDKWIDRASEFSKRIDKLWFGGFN